MPAEPDAWPEPATVPHHRLVDRAGHRGHLLGGARPRRGPAWGLVVVDLPEGGRGYGRVDDADLLAAMEAEEWVGRTVTATPDGPVNRVHA